jgi:histone H3/H4
LEVVPDEELPPPLNVSQYAAQRCRADTMEQLAVRPRRAQTPWTLFILERFGNRPSREAGEAWKAIGDDERQLYVERASVDKARHQREMAEYEKLLQDHPELAPRRDAEDDPSLDVGATCLPAMKVRKIMRQTDELKGVAKDGVFAVCKSAELLVAMLTEQCSASARRHKRKTIGLQDFGLVLHGAQSADLLAFMHADFPPKDAMLAPRARAPRPAAEGRAPVRSAATSLDEMMAAAATRAPRRASRAPQDAAQTTTMKSFFGAMPSDAAASADDGGGDGVVEDDADDENIGAPAREADAGARKRRAVIDDDDE